MQTLVAYQYTMYMCGADIGGREACNREERLATEDGVKAPFNSVRRETTCNLHILTI